MSNPSLPDSEASPWLVQQWILAGIVSSAARFIPIPYVDEYVRDRCRRFVVSRTLAAHEKPEWLDPLQPYYSSSGGFLSSVAGKAARLPLKLLLFPIRKAIAIATSIRGVPLEIMRTVLLARSLDRILQSGPESIDSEQAKAMRQAFDQTFKRMDFRVFKAAMSDVFDGVSGLKAAAIGAARRIAQNEEESPEKLEAEQPLRKGAERVQEVFNRPEILKLFAEFDRRYEKACYWNVSH
ncbi:hypothetical protein Q31b_00350 [Novipirellula aureliae]|uniref:Uncharacterized protein n=1 Tax=Novipirellula aureliae TaxID=2527966 RepID=A0A5C6E8L6_9BACT|nr:hypothetical protein [Novipirellula aureliae]TWU44865.1 hypothetical protein Q31b_00350 [Novipirellula aureliae]